jgi:hypothetical protein
MLQWSKVSNQHNDTYAVGSQGDPLPRNILTFHRSAVVAMKQARVQGVKDPVIGYIPPRSATMIGGVPTVPIV